MTLDEMVNAFEREAIVNALTQAGGVQAAAAALLGISERSMWYRVAKYGIHPVYPLREGRDPVRARLRFDVLARDGFRCRYCGASGQEARLEADHIIPISGGGPTTLDNLITACHLCNRGKADARYPDLLASIPVLPSPHAPQSPTQAKPEGSHRGSGASRRDAADPESVREDGENWGVRGEPDTSW